MWINIDKDEVELLKALFTEMAAGEKRDTQLFWNDAVEGNKEAREACIARSNKYEALAQKILDREAEDTNPTFQAYRNAVDTNDELEVDPGAVVSMGDDPGAWVMTWTWVTNESAGIDDEDDEDDVCITCGEKYDPGGDGFDGECPSCADKTDQKLYPENYE